MASLKKTKVIDPPCRLGFSTTESVRRRIEAARVLYEDAHGVPYDRGELLGMMLVAWLDQDSTLRERNEDRALTPEQLARVEQAMRTKAEA